MTAGKKPPIAVACSSPSWGGMEMQSVLSARELAGRGYPVLFLTGRRTRAGEEAASAGLTVRPILSRNHIAPIAIVRAARLLRREAVRLVHAEYSKDLWTLVPATRLAGGIPVLLTKRLASSVDKKDPIHRRLYAGTARIIAISSAIKENILKRTDVPAERIVVLPNGVDLARFTPEEGSRERAREELGIPPGAPAVGLVGRISRGKGHLAFVRGAALLRQSFPEARFLIVGSVTDGEKEYDRAVRSLVSELGLEERVIFAGFREDVPRVLSALDALVVPSRSEALGNVVLEGMAARLPIAAAGEAGIRDIVVDGETGLLFPPDDPPRLADAVRRLLEDASLRRAMGAKGRRRVEDLFDRKKRTDRIEELYAEVLLESGSS
jgi:glycosyltransferase involved in cell wall biosynthesis